MNSVVNDGQVVSVAYVLKDDSGQILDQAEKATPFAYLHGYQQIVPGLEKALSGKAPGDKLTVKVAPAEGYGEYQQSLMVNVARNQFPDSMNLAPGMKVQGRAAEGGAMFFVITALEGSQVTLDGNHPFAGVTLNFDVEVLDVRAATKEELEHQHVHGPDGHHHH